MFEYKVVPAPVRTVKVKGLKTTAERFAHLVAESLNAEAGEGWEYLRAETLPFEEKKGFTGTSRGFQTVLVFRRALDLGFDEGAGPDADDHTLPEPAVNLRAPEPTAPVEGAGIARFPAFGRAEPVIRPDALHPSEGATRAEPVLRARAEETEGDETGRESR